MDSAKLCTKKTNLDSAKSFTKNADTWIPLYGAGCYPDVRKTNFDIAIYLAGWYTNVPEIDLDSAMSCWIEPCCTRGCPKATLV